MADPTFADLVEQARSLLIIGCPAVEQRDDDEWSEPAWQQHVDETVAQMQTLHEDGLPDGLGLDLAVPASALHVREDGEDCYSPLDGTATPDDLRRVAARAVVAHALLRREAEEQMLIALIALDLTKPVDERRYRIGSWSPEEIGPKATLDEEVVGTARNLGLEKAEASLAAMRGHVEAKRAQDLPLNDWPNLVAAWEKAVATLREEASNG